MCWPGNSGPVADHDPQAQRTGAGRDHRGAGHRGGPLPQPPGDAGHPREAGVPVAAPSANLSGRPSCTSAQDVMEDMDGRIEGVVDADPAWWGGVHHSGHDPGEPPRLLRPADCRWRSWSGSSAPSPWIGPSPAPCRGGASPAPGMKYRHYAPKAPLRWSRRAGQVRPGGSSAGWARLRVICFDEYVRMFRTRWFTPSVR